MASFLSRSSAASALILLGVLTACGGPGGDDSASSDAARNGPIVPVVTSVVGLPPSGSGTTKRVQGTTSSSRPSTTAVAPDFGESNQPVTVPSGATTAPVDPASASAAEAASRSFLERFWAPGARTSAQLADAVAPFATAKLLSVYRDPANADRAAPGTGVSDFTAHATEANRTTATVAGRGTLADEPDKRQVFITLKLIVGADGVWRVDELR
jgi:hypothetical protein